MLQEEVVGEGGAKGHVKTAVAWSISKSASHIPSEPLKLIFLFNLFTNLRNNFLSLHLQGYMYHHFTKRPSIYRIIFILCFIAFVIFSNIF